MSWLGRSIGEFGSQAGQAQEISQSWKQREQEMLMARARQKLADVMGPLQLSELQGRIKEMQQPKPEGIINTPGGGSAGITYQNGKYNSQQIQGGADPAKIKAQILDMAKQAPKEYQAALQAHASSIDAGEDPMKALDKAQALMGTAAGKQEKTRFKFDPEKGIIAGADGKEWSIYDPQLPPELKTLVDSQKRKKHEEMEEKASLDARKNAEAMSRALTIGDRREANKHYDELLKTAKRGIAGHSFYSTIEKQVEEARKSKGQDGTTSGDSLIVEGFMQLMFGVDPKALRGSPAMMQQLMKQGGADDRAIAWWNQVKSGGRLSQSVRDEILENSKAQVGAWDQFVRQNGELVDEPKVKQLVNRYSQMVGGDSKESQPKDDGVGFKPDAN